MLQAAGVHATFFILGWIAERAPDLVRAIAAAGHEIASHGFAHRRVTTESRSAFRDDIRRSKALLEKICGAEVIGYRAPSYSISGSTLWAFDELLAAGYRYDSSIFPVRHDLYGINDWPRFPGLAVRRQDGDWYPAERAGAGDQTLAEFPISTLRLAGQNIPVGGGGYFRLFPYRLTRWSLERINSIDGKPFLFYVHPWEFDPAQPRMQGAGWKSRFRHYLNLERTEPRFQELLRDFRFAPIRAAFDEQSSAGQTAGGVPLTEARTGLS